MNETYRQLQVALLHCRRINVYAELSGLEKLERESELLRVIISQVLDEFQTHYFRELGLKPK